MVRVRIVRKDGVVQRYNVKSIKSVKDKGYVYDRKNRYWIKPVRVLTKEGIREMVVKPDKLQEYTYDKKRDIYYKPVKVGEADKPRRVTVSIYVRYDSRDNFVEIDSHVTFDVKVGENVDAKVDEYRDKLLEFLREIFSNIDYLMAEGVVKQDVDLESDMDKGYLIRYRHSRKKQFRVQLYDLDGNLIREWSEW
jgi:hypothetical protein